MIDAMTQNKDAVIEKIGEKKFLEEMEVLEKLKKQEANKGVF